MARSNPGFEDQYLLPDTFTPTDVTASSEESKAESAAALWISFTQPVTMGEVVATLIISTRDAYYVNRDIANEKEIKEMVIKRLDLPSDYFNDPEWRMRAEEIIHRTFMDTWVRNSSLTLATLTDICVGLRLQRSSCARDGRWRIRGIIDSVTERAFFIIHVSLS